MSMTDEPIVMASDSNGAVAEAYRSLRVALTKQLLKGKKVLTFVSAWPGDGKSMVATNVAVALSQMHQKVLLVDGDLRRPTISRVFGAQSLPGISESLDSAGDDVNLGYETRYPSLWLLPRGLSEKNPSNLLNPDRLARVFRGLRNAYDAIIVDTPPLSACSDALLLGEQSDGASLVVSPKGWDGEVELRYKQQLEDHGILVLGVVLNGAMGAESHGYGYGYGSGYGYGYGGGYGKGGYGNYGDKKPAKRKPRGRGFSLPWSRPDDES